MIKKTLSAIALTMMCSTSYAESSMDNDSVNILRGKLKQVSASLGSSPISLDDTHIEFKKETGSKQIPVMFNQKVYLLSKEGDNLVDPSSSFFFNNGKVEKAVDVLWKIKLSKTGGWPKLDLPEGMEKKGDVYVLSDPTCGYCKKFDKSVDKYTNNGIVVHYIPYPRSGVGGDRVFEAGFSRWASASCAENPGVAYKEISLGDLTKYPVPDDLSADCTSVIKRGYELGSSLGVTGTPIIFAKDNNGNTVMTGGYASPEVVASGIGVKIKG
jgi:thiol:disulfide interchange protein DsbC